MRHLKAFDRQVGVTFVEVIVVVVIIAILAAVAIPSYSDYIERQRWYGAADAIYSQLVNAERTAISNNADIYFLLRGTSTAWCAGISEVMDLSADCSDSSNMYVNSSSANPSVVIQGSAFPNITATTSGGFMQFQMPEVVVTNPHTISVTSYLGTISIQATDGMGLSICSSDTGRYEC